jgi:hypothetical protein
MSFDEARAEEPAQGQGHASDFEVPWVAALLGRLAPSTTGRHHKHKYQYFEVVANKHDDGGPAWTDW